MAARIKVAREEGDLKENAEYHIAKEDQAHLETRIKRLRERLAQRGRRRGDDGDADTFAFGRTAEVLDEDKGEVNTWTLVGSTEADLADGRLSAESPIGRALMDAKVGKPIKVETPRGTAPSSSRSSSAEPQANSSTQTTAASSETTIIRMPSSWSCCSCASPMSSPAGGRITAIRNGNMR